MQKQSKENNNPPRSQCQVFISDCKLLSTNNGNNEGGTCKFIYCFDLSVNCTKPFLVWQKCEKESNYTSRDNEKKVRFEKKIILYWKLKN